MNVELRPIASLKQQSFDTFNEINRQLQSGTEFTKVLDFLFDSLMPLIPYDRIGIALLEDSEEKRELSSKWVKSKRTVSHLLPGYSALVAGSSLEHVLESREPRIINDLSSYLESHPNSVSTRLILEDGIRSSLTCPLTSEGKSIGVVFFSSFTPETYSVEHIDFFLKIANEISLIVEYGRLRKSFDIYQTQSKNLGMILHDLRSPLSVIQGCAELALERAGDNESVEVILRSSQQMARLLAEVAENMRLDREARPPAMERVELRRFLAEVLAVAERLASAKSMTVISDVGENLCQTAEFDEEQILRVLENLISNAIKFSNRGSTVRIGVSSGAGRIVFCVCDDGPGIPEEEQKKLFTEFGKTSVRPTENEASSGLGLAIAKKIVVSHGGEISVSSQIGEGSIFSFWIPRIRSSPWTPHS